MYCYVGPELEKKEEKRKKKKWAHTELLTCHLAVSTDIVCVNSLAYCCLA